MKHIRMKITYATLLITSVIAVVSLRPTAYARGNGTVKATVKAPVGNYRAWLFKTGDAKPFKEPIQFKIEPYKGATVTFDNIPTGSRYFIRVVDTNCVVGGQTADGNLKSGTLSLPQCQVTPKWSSGCP